MLLVQATDVHARALLLAALAFSSAPVHRDLVIGHSVEGRAIEAVEVGDPTARTKVVVVGCIHGNEDAGIAVVSELERDHLPPGVAMWLVVDMNPDGRAAATRDDARGVDLNRNFPWHWKKIGKPGALHYSGPHALSEPESRAVYRLIRHVRPQLVIWYHQALDVVDVSGGDLAIERRYAEVAGMSLKRLPRYHGSATSWANHALPDATSFVVELPAGELTTAETIRHASAVIDLARGLAAERSAAVR
jgi:protein MpaA